MLANRSQRSLSTGAGGITELPLSALVDGMDQVDWNSLKKLKGFEKHLRMQVPDLTPSAAKLATVKRQLATYQNKVFNLAAEVGCQLLRDSMASDGAVVGGTMLITAVGTSTVYSVSLGEMFQGTSAPMARIMDVVPQLAPQVTTPCCTRAGQILLAGCCMQCEALGVTLCRRRMQPLGTACPWTRQRAGCWARFATWLW